MSPSNLERLNDIKGREHFRPVAPMVLDRYAEDIFTGGPLPSPYMLFVHRVRPEWADRRRAQWDDTEHEVDRWCRPVTWCGGACDRQDVYLERSEARSSEILLHPGAAAPARRWPPDRWAQLAAHLVTTGNRVTLTGGPAETALCHRIVETVKRSRPDAAAPANTAGQLGLPDLANRVGRAKLLVSGDTGVAHLATAYRTPSVLLFGPTPPHRWGPCVDPRLHTVLWHGADDRPGIRTAPSSTRRSPRSRSPRSWPRSRPRSTLQPGEPRPEPGPQEELHPVPRYRFTVVTMTNSEPAATPTVPAVCTLPTPEQPLRLAEFDALFASDVTGVQRVMDDTALLTLRPQAAVAARAADLAVRETECCSFFEFAVTATGGHLVMQIRTPPSQIAVLDAVVDWARSASIRPTG